MKRQISILLFIFIGVINLYSGVDDTLIGVNFITEKNIENIGINGALIPYIKKSGGAIQYEMPAAGLSAGSLSIFNLGLLLNNLGINENGNGIGTWWNIVSAGGANNDASLLLYSGVFSYGYKFVIDDETQFSVGLGLKISGWSLGNYSVAGDTAISGSSFDLAVSYFMPVNEETSVSVICDNIMKSRNDAGVSDNESSISRNSRNIIAGISYLPFETLVIASRIKIIDELYTEMGVGVKQYISVKKDWNIWAEGVFGYNATVINAGVGMKMSSIDINYMFSYNFNLSYAGAHKIGIVYSF